MGLGLAACLVGRAADEPVALPPFLVEEVAKGPPWRYAETPGYEVLSRCNDKVTRRVVESHQNLHVLLAEVLPPSLQFTVSQPRAMIVYDEELQPTASREVISKLLHSGRDSSGPPEDYPAPSGRRGINIPPPTRHYSFLPNLRLVDRDEMSVFMIVRRDDFDPDVLVLVPDYIAYLLKQRVPALPPWFSTGFLALYRQMTCNGKELSLPPLEWLSDAQTSAVKKDPKAAPALRPLDEFFAGRPPPPEEMSRSEWIKLWQAQAALFVRWGLEGKEGIHRLALWKFTERVAAEGVSEALFQECFSLDYASAREQLAAYLPVAVARSATFKPAQAFKPEPMVFRNASDAQIARIKGDWERLEVPYVKAISADLAPKYLEQARHTLKRAYDRDERDAGMLAVMGLCEVDAGNDGGAREYLESAANIGPIRVRANYELARLRFAELRTKLTGPNDRLSVNQVAEVMKPLFAARALQPPLPEVYELIADTWMVSASAPTRRHLAVLDEGIRLFPFRTQLILRAAEVNLRYGFRDAAVPLIDLASRLADDDASRERVMLLQVQLATK